MNYKEHPRLHDEGTLLVIPHERFGRVDYSPANELAFHWLRSPRHKKWTSSGPIELLAFNEEDLKFIISLDYCVLMQQEDGSYKEFTL